VSISLNFRQAMYASETGRFPIGLITISHEDLVDDILVSTDPTARLEEYTTNTEVVYGTVSRGKKFIFFPMRIKLPNDTDEGPGEMSIEIDNVHRTYVETIRSIVTPALFTVEWVLDNALDTVEISWPEFQMVNARYNETLITATLKLETQEREPFPSGTFSPAYFGGLF
jgi:hypothetical protein